jgi:hypothetical protein
MFADKWIPTGQAIGLCLLLVSFPLAAQTNVSEAVPGVFTASGSGTAASEAEAEEAARLDAVNNVVFKEMRHDSVYRDLFVSEAFKNGWFDPAKTKKDEAGKWTAIVTIRVDESLAEALYVGRYSTTVGSLLDAAEEAFIEIKALQNKGGTSESNGDLAAAESAYRRAESKAVETMRYLGPVEDAMFFSSTGNRKAPELKALIVAAKDASVDSIARIRSAQERLAMDAEARNVLDLLDSVEADLVPAEEAADALHPLAAAPRSYETQLLRDGEARGRSVRESLARKRGIVAGRTANLPAEMTYPKTRAELLLDRIDALDRSLKTSVAAISSELTKRKPAVKIAAWTLNHQPLDFLSIGVLFPFGLSPQAGGTVGVRLPAAWNVRAEGAFPMGAGGFWARSRFRAGDEDSTTVSDYTVTQGIDVGFFGKRLVGFGFRWDWLREDESGDRSSSIPAIALTLGDVGEGLGKTTYAPWWTVTAAWELPSDNTVKSKDNVIPVRALNLALDATIRPSTWLRFDADASARTRTREASDWWIGSLGFGFGFRLPVLKPLLWKLRWEGSMTSRIIDEQIQENSAVTTGAFRFGLEYTF